MLGSAQGGINIEEAARDNPESIVTQKFDLETGVSSQRKSEQLPSLWASKGTSWIRLENKYDFIVNHH